jgi:hypothetical protein
MSREYKKRKVDIYRKPTTTDTTIYFFSNHPIEQKMATYRYHITGMHSLPLDQDKKQERMENSKNNGKNNNFPQLVQKLN